MQEQIQQKSHQKTDCSYGQNRKNNQSHGLQVTMNKYSLSGIISWIAAGCITGFQGIKTLMNTNYAWHDITLWDSGNRYIQNIPDYIHVDAVHNALEFLIHDFPLYQLLLVIGLICFIISSFSRK